MVEETVWRGSRISNIFRIAWVEMRNGGCVRVLAERVDELGRHERTVHTVQV